MNRKDPILPNGDLCSTYCTRYAQAHVRPVHVLYTRVAYACYSMYGLATGDDASVVSLQVQLERRGYEELI